MMHYEVEYRYKITVVWNRRWWESPMSLWRAEKFLADVNRNHGVENRIVVIHDGKRFVVTQEGRTDVPD